MSAITDTHHISYKPSYNFFVRKGDGSEWNLRTLVNVQAMSTTANGVNQLHATFADPRGQIMDGVQPHAMNVVCLQARNWRGQLGNVWTGVVDEVHDLRAATSGKQIQLIASGPVKYLEITSQTPSDVVSLAVAYANNVSGKEVLQYACQQSGYPTDPRWLIYDDEADSGSGYQDVLNAGVLTNPDQAKWSAVIGALQVNSGMEWFTDEAGRMFWRRVGFLEQGYTPRQILLSEILNADLYESDRGVVTKVEVRYGLLPLHQGAPFRQGPDVMVQHLRQRVELLYADWVTNEAAAKWLADTLFDQAAAGILAGVIQIPLDPMIGLGTLIKLPNMRTLQTTVAPNDFPGRGGSIYYVSGKLDEIDWGARCVSTLVLSYGRASTQQFPYFGLAGYPQTNDTGPAGVTAGLPNDTPIQPLNVDPNNPMRFTNRFTVQQQSGLTNSQVSSTLFAPGAIIQVQAADGSHIGPTKNGEYTVVAAPSTQDTDVLGFSKTYGATVGYVTYIQDGQNPTQSTGSPGPASSTVGTAFSATPPPSTKGSGPGRGDTTATVPQTPHFKPTTWALKALSKALTVADPPGVSHYNSPDAGADGKWDCSGLVAWAYAQIGIPDLMRGPNGDCGPQGEYDYFLGKGAKPIDPSLADTGDLLFIQAPQSAYPNLPWWAAAQRGFLHVGFCLKPGWQYAANDYDTGIRAMPIGGYASHGWPYNLALDMSSVVLG